MTQEIQAVQQTSIAGTILGSWRMRMLAVGVTVTSIAFWAVMSNEGSVEPEIFVDTAGAQVPEQPAPAVEVEELAALFESREPIPVAPVRPVVSAPGDAPVTEPAEDPGAIQVDVAPPDAAGSLNEPVSATLHPTPFWVNAFSTESTLDGRPLAVGDIVTAFDPLGVLIGRFEVETEGKYGLMALYMDDPSTAIDEGATPGETISFKINGLPAEVLGPHQPVWSSNGDILLLNLAATSE